MLVSGLKITNIETVLLSYRYNENELWKWSGGTTLQRNTVLVKVETNQGIYGIGEIGESAFLPISVKQIIEERFKPLLLEEDPTNIENYGKNVYMVTHMVVRV